VRPLPAARFKISRGLKRDRLAANLLLTNPTVPGAGPAAETTLAWDRLADAIKQMVSKN